MDIAKIRKKIKEASQEGVAKPEPAQARELGRAESVSLPQEEQDVAEKETVAPVEEVGPSAAAEKVESVIDLLTFSLAKEEYAFRIDEILEIIRPQRITKIPKTESFLLGITSLRGKIIPVIDLKKMLSLDGSGGEKSMKQKILILNGPKGPIGALIDRVIGVIRPSAASIIETPAHLPEAEMRYIEGVALKDGRFISIIRIEEAVTL